MYIYRDLEDKIQKFLKRKESLAIIGPRQAGKTTFLKHLECELEKQKKTVKFITFEKKVDLHLFQDSIEDFKDLIIKYDYVIIDEFQYADNGGQKLKYLFDTTKIKFIVSGSSSLELTFQTGKYMVGRIFNFELWPFSFREFLSIKDKELFNLLNKRFKKESLLNFKIKQGFGKEINQRLSKYLEEYMAYGGYPAVVLAKTKIEKQKVLESIVENYYLKDVASLLKLATEDELLKLQKVLATQISNLINYKELSNVCGLVYKDLLKHLNILEKTYVIKLLKPFFTNKRTELVKNPKAYYIDLGLRNWLLNDFRNLENRNDMGMLAENYALNMMQKNDLAKEIKYWRTKSQAEVDFVLEKNQMIYPIEIKYSSSNVIGKSLYSFIHKFSCKKAIILTKDYLGEQTKHGCKFQFIPLSYF
ncbi:ATP-binding protein [Patescibacteria group bacterium]|nr:ATP-binding protein [Patescibacteria group bacterium]